VVFNSLEIRLVSENTQMPLGQAQTLGWAVVLKALFQRTRKCDIGTRVAMKTSYFINLRSTSNMPRLSQFLHSLGACLSRYCTCRLVKVLLRHDFFAVWKK
jgi:hypothetical protein